MIICKHCGNINQALFEQSEHRREQVTCRCTECGHTFIYYFLNVKPEDPLQTLKEEMDAKARASKKQN